MYFIEYKKHSCSQLMLQWFDEIIANALKPSKNSKAIKQEFKLKLGAEKLVEHQGMCPTYFKKTF